MAASRGSEIRTIVVGVDGSPSSAAAVRWAAGQAVAHGATLRAVTAWLPGAGTVGSGLPRTTTVDGADAAERTLDLALSNAGVDGAGAGPSAGGGGQQVTVERSVVQGSPAKVLIDASSEADLLVVGSRGLGGFAGLLLGSVSHQVTQHGRCPVVVIRPPEGADGSGPPPPPA